MAKPEPLANPIEKNKLTAAAGAEFHEWFTLHYQQLSSHSLP